MQALKVIFNLNEKLWDLIKHSSTYFLGNALIASLTFFGTAFLTRILSPQGYAIVNLVESYKSFFIVLVTLNGYTSLGRYLYESYDDKKEFIGTLLIFCLLMLFLFQLFVCISTDYFSELLSLPKEVSLLLGFFVFIYLITSFYEQTFIPLKESNRIITRKVIISFGSFFLGIAFALMSKNNEYLAYLYGVLVVGIFCSLAFLFELRNHIKLKFELKHLKYMISYSIPLLPYSLSGVILAQFDKVMINDIIGKMETAFYSLAGNIAMAIPLLNSSFAMAWTPNFYNYMEKNDTNSLIYEFRLLLRVLFIASFVLVLFAKEVVTLLSTKTYGESIEVLPILILGYFIYISFTYYSWIFSFYKRNLFLSSVVLLGGVLNIVLNYFFITFYGYTAAAFTTMFAYGFMLLLTYGVIRFYFKVFYFPLNQILFSLLLLSLLVLVVRYLNMIHYFTLWQMFFFKLIILASVLGYAFYKYFYPELRKKHFV
ncbi:hypothetical protein LPTSP4_03260 [Leptospira ryugenii]|uniref:Uncharacterized protein n=1 Tax=Leptospira ryugenii TaxID=1917863 RepID=A0A2P2DW28_9LEPT|nr:oligosaccharide flippase family protein [Leptospira ryugenii]GBF48826.1 hypothetical protein LPTSP4_03260 [Leptospira ryugenii]